MHRLTAAIFLLVLNATVVSQEPSGAGAQDSPVVGVGVVDITDAAAALKKNKLSVPSKFGIVLVKVDPFGPAAKAGLSPLDVVTLIDKTPIKTREDFVSAIASRNPGDKCEFTGYRVVRAPNGKATWKKGSVDVGIMSRRELLMARFSESRDKFRDITFTHHSHEPKSGQSVYLYIARKDGSEPMLRLVLRYHSDEWLFVNSYAVKIGDKTTNIEAGLTGVEREVLSAGNLQEVYDTVVTPEIFAMLKSLTAEKHGDIRYTGKSRVHDRSLTDTEIEQMHDMMEMFSILIKERK